MKKIREKQSIRTLLLTLSVGDVLNGFFTFFILSKLVDVLLYKKGDVYANDSNFVIIVKLLKEFSIQFSIILALFLLVKFFMNKKTKT